MRPRLYVLAGVNGAGKSTLLGRALVDAGQAWFNPDTYARRLMDIEGCARELANARAWAEGMRQLDRAIVEQSDYAFETTLGGRTVPEKILAAASTHEVVIWFCGLVSVDVHIARVRARVVSGGHDIPEASIRARYVNAPRNLIMLMPHLAHLQVYDNSTTVPIGSPVPEPQLVLDMTSRALIYPRADDIGQLQQTPTWAIPIVEAALQHFER